MVTCEHLNNILIMLKNNIIIAFRLLKRQRVYSIINILGLSLGFASFLLIVLFYQYQYSYDTFHSKKDRIFRINKHLDGQGQGKIRVSRTSPKVAEMINGNISGIKNTVRLAELSAELHSEDASFNELFMYAADNSFFDVFDFKLTSGNPKSALKQLNSIVLGKSMAKKYFGDEPALGKTMTTIDMRGRKVDLTVTGIMEDIPANTHLMINALFSFPTLKNFVTADKFDASWSLCHTYILLDESANREHVEQQIADLVLKHVPLNDFKTASLPIQPIQSIYFNPTKDGGAQRGDELVTDVFLLVGVLLLLIASLNYINLATARSLKRSKEVGIRKVSGADKKQLIYQFIGESIFICLVALLMSFVLVYFFIPYVNNFSSIIFRIHLNQHFFIDPNFLFIAVPTAIITGILSGLYPAFVISSFKPSKSLKGESVNPAKISTKQVLVVMQYVVSIFLVIFCLTVYKFFNHMKNQDFGFDNENILAFRIDKLKEPGKVYDLKNKIKQLNGVLNIAASSKVPLSMQFESSVKIFNAKYNMKRDVSTMYIDEDFFNLLELEIVQKVGSNQDDEEIAKGLMVNEGFLRAFEEQYALGDAVDVYDRDNMNTVSFTGNIRSVVKDFNNRLFNIGKDPGPEIYILDDNKLSFMLVRLAPNTQHETIASIESVFKSNFPYLTFDFSFVDDEMDFVYDMFRPFTTLMYYFTFLAIFIASMGLFALALFITQQRTKEISIRKIFGSSELGISILLVKQYLRLILISFLITGPVTFIGFRQLLLMLPQKVEFSWLLLVMVGAGLILLAIITVVGQAWKAARTNPVDTLRFE